MLLKQGTECLITEVPPRSFPVDGALGMKEIVDVVTEQDIIVQHSVLLDEGELTSQEESNLKQPIREECAHNTATLRRVKQTKVSAEQVATLEDGGVVFLPESSTRGCKVMVIFLYFCQISELNVLFSGCCDQLLSSHRLVLAKPRHPGPRSSPQRRPQGGKTHLLFEHTWSTRPLL